jgi:hypothetical protein
MIINLFRPPTNRRLKTGSGLGGGKYPLISPHERSTLAPVNNPDLSCHILTSSPSFQIGFLPCRVQYHHLGVPGHLRYRILFPACLVMISSSLVILILATMLPRRPSVYPHQGRSRHSNGPRCFIYRISHSQLFSYSPLFACISNSLHCCRWPHQNTHMLMMFLHIPHNAWNVLPLPSLQTIRDVKRVQ